MRYTVTLTQKRNGAYLATVPLIPGLQREGKNREETLAAVREALQESLLSTEFVTIELPALTKGVYDNPWLMTAGMFADDETLLTMLDTIYNARDNEPDPLHS